MDNLNLKIEAAVFKRLIKHLRENTDIQNIDIMETAGFCRNCLSRWYLEESLNENINISKEEARNYIYGMDYDEWKSKYQK
tara:strand:- start:129 stop:371 length:243 start_codon:yes stop_codon:yes gene_type:complete